MKSALIDRHDYPLCFGDWLPNIEAEIGFAVAARANGSGRASGDDAGLATTSQRAREAAKLAAECNGAAGADIAA